MKRFLLVILIAPFTLKAQQSGEPIAKKIPKELTIHNHKRIDNYFWMNERDAKPVLDYISEENKISEAFFGQQKPMIDKLLAEFESRIDPNEQSAPFEVNGKIYQVQYTESLDYPKIIHLNGAKTTVLIDENDRAAKKTFYELADWSPSPDNKLLALSEDFVGRRNYTISVRNYGSTKFLTDKIEGTDGSLCWANDNKTLFYVKIDPQTLRSFQVYRHVLGTKQSSDVLVFEDKDEKFNVSIGKSMNSQYIIINSESTTTTEELLIDANNPASYPKVFLARKPGHLYRTDVHNNGFYILSNDNAPNKKLLFCSKIPTTLGDCNEIIAHSKETLLEQHMVLDKYIVIQERNNGLLKLRSIDLATKQEKYISIDDETYYLGLASNDNYNATQFYYFYNSMTTPSSVIKYDLISGNKALFFQNKLIDPTFSSDNYESQRIWATANDGSKIPVSFVYKKGTDLKSAPCLLYAYGSYGYTFPDVFSATRLSLLDRGFVYALAHVRGGKYLGEEWYENGKLNKKINTFTDFINVAEYLGMKGYCDNEKIYAMGGSAGGLLMGAVTNMAPYLFKGVVAQVPFVDVVTTMLDESIPLTVGEYEEWGNPNEEEFYYYMLNYSPYDNVKRMDYPNLLITTGYHDSQVQYWEPLKWIAKLREYRTNANLLMLDCNMDAGHGGGSGRSTERLEKAKEFAFILSLEGIR